MPRVAEVERSEPSAAGRTITGARWGSPSAPPPPPPTLSRGPPCGPPPATPQLVAAIARTTCTIGIVACCTLTTQRLRPIYRWEYLRLIRLDFALKRAEDRPIFAADLRVRTRLGDSEPAPGPRCARLTVRDQS